MRDGIGRNVRRRGGRFGSSRITTSSTASSDEAMEMESRARKGKRPITDDTLVNEDHYSQEEGVVTASISTPIGSGLAI